MRPNPDAKTALCGRSLGGGIDTVSTCYTAATDCPRCDAECVRRWPEERFAKTHGRQVQP